MKFWGLFVKINRQIEGRFFPASAWQERKQTITNFSTFVVSRSLQFRALEIRKADDLLSDSGLQRKLFGGSHRRQEESI